MGAKSSAVAEISHYLKPLHAASYLRTKYTRYQVSIYTYMRRLDHAMHIINGLLLLVTINQAKRERPNNIRSSFLSIVYDSASAQQHIMHTYIHTSSNMLRGVLLIRGVVWLLSN